MNLILFTHVLIKVIKAKSYFALYSVHRCIDLSYTVAALTLLMAADGFPSLR